MAKLIKFKYQKGTDVTNRVAFVLVKPSTNYSMLEIVDDAGYEVAEMEDEIKQEFARHSAVIKDLSARFGLQYKNFTGTNVFEVEEL